MVEYSMLVMPTCCNEIALAPFATMPRVNQAGRCRAPILAKNWATFCRISR